MSQYPVNLHVTPEVISFFDDDSNTFSYIVKDPASAACAVFDSVLDLDYAAGRITQHSADQILAYITGHKLDLEWIIETHVHADHLSAAPYLQQQGGGKIGIGEQIVMVQQEFGKIFNDGTEFQRDGSQFDRLFSDGDTYTIGSMTAFAMATPGHTPACMVHVIGDAAFVGDTLFMPDGGSARADFPGGDAGQLYDSIQKVLALPDDVRLFICHDYGPGGREIASETTVGQQKRENIHAASGISRDQFIEMRTTRDATLKMPKLILPSIQVNMRAGDLPADHDGRPVIRIPINAI